ncbi:YSIRK-type signal peptide-containing protein, partial [Gemella sp.]
MRYQYKNGEKLTRFSIRKYHFGAASVAVASLIFFGGGMSAKAENIPTSENAQVIGKSADGSSSGDKNSKLDDKSTSAQDKSAIVEKTADVVAAVNVDKAELKKLAISLDTLFRTTEKDKIASIYDEVNQSISEAKLVLDKDTASTEEVNTQVAKLTEITKKLKETVVKADKTTEKVKGESRQIDEKKSVDNKVNISVETDKKSESSVSEKKESENQKSIAPNRGKLETLAKSLDVYLKSSNEITRPETKELLKGVEETVLAVKKGLENPQLTASEIEELVKQGKEAEKKLALAVARENSGKRDSRNGSKMLPESYFRAPNTREGANTEFGNAYTAWMITSDDFRRFQSAGTNDPNYYGYNYQVGTFLYNSNNAENSPINNNNMQGPQRIAWTRNRVYVQVNRVSGNEQSGYEFNWKIQFNNGREPHQKPFYYFTLPDGHNFSSSVVLKENESQLTTGSIEDVLEKSKGRLNGRMGTTEGVNGKEYYLGTGLINGRPYIQAPIRTLEDFVKNSTNYYFNRSGVNGEIIQKSDFLFENIRNSTKNIIAIQPQEAAAGGASNTYSFEFSTHSNSADSPYYVAGVKTYETTRGLTQHRSYSQWGTLKDAYTIKTDSFTNADFKKKTFLKGTQLGVIEKDSFSFNSTNAATSAIGDRFIDAGLVLRNNATGRDERPQKGRLLLKVTPTATLNGSQYSHIHNLYDPNDSSNWATNSTDRTKGGHLAYLEGTYNGSTIKLPFSFSIVTQSDIFEPIKNETKENQARKTTETLGNAADFISGYKNVSSRIPDLFTNWSEGNTDTLRRIFKGGSETFPGSSDEIKRRAIKNVEWADGNSNISGEKIVPVKVRYTPQGETAYEETKYVTLPPELNNLSIGQVLTEAQKQKIIELAKSTFDADSASFDGNTAKVGVKKQVKITYMDNEKNALTGNKDDSVRYVDFHFTNLTVPDSNKPVVTMNGRTLTTNAEENQFIIYRGAAFNPTFKVTDESKISSLMVTNLPKGVYFNKVDNVDKERVGTTTVLNHTISDADSNKVADDATLGEQIASVEASDQYGNRETYKFKYRIVDIQAKNSTTENRAVGSTLGDPHDHFKVAESTTADSDKYYPTNMQFKWFNSSTFSFTDSDKNTKLNELGTITKYIATAVFPGVMNTKEIDGVNYTIYSPAQKAVQMTFNVTDSVAPTVKMTNPTNNTESVLGSNENNLPVVEVFRGATLNIPLKMSDNNTNGKINIKHINGLPTGVNLNNGNTLSQNSGSETNPATATITGRVAETATLGTSTVTLKVSDDATGSVDKGNNTTLKFKVKTYDLAFEDRGTRVDDNTRSDVLGLNTQSLDPNHYLAITDGANVTNDWGSGMVFRYLKGNEIRETVSFDKIGKHSVKARAYFPTNKTSTKGLPTNPPGLTGDTASVNGRGFLEKTVEFNVKPNTPTISQPQFNGTAGIRPNVTVENLPTNAQLQNGANVTVELYQGTTKVASKTVTDRNGTTTLSTRDFTTNLTEGQQVHAVVKVSGGQGATAYSVSSDNSERRNVTGYNLVARDIINVKRGETISADELKRFIQVQEGNQRVDLPQGATVTATLDTNSIRSGSEETKTVEATVNFGENRTKKVSLTYKVLNTFPIANTIYDFKDVTRSNEHSDYYKNTGNNIPSGMSWVYKRSGGAEQVGTSFKTTLASDPVGTTSYEFIGKYNYGRFTNSPSESEKLVHKETLVHKVFDIADSKNVSVSQGTTLSVEQAKAAVKNATGSDTLPTGTTYQWVGNNVASTSGKQTFQVKVTLPVSQTGDNLPAATQATPSKTINVTVNVTPPKPTFDSNKVTSTSRTITGTLGGLNANSSNTVVSVALNDGTNRVLTSENNGGVRISGNTWTATLPDDVKLRTSVAKNGETTQPTGLTVTTKIKGSTTADDISVVGDVKAVEMGDYSVNATIAGSKHIDVKVPHDAKRMELRFHNSTETSNTPKSIVLVRSQNGGNWQVDSTATPAGVTDANNFVQAITNTVNASNKAENLVTITLKESYNNSKLRIKEENASGDNTATYSTGLGLRVDYKPEPRQAVTPVGNWKVVSVTNNKPTLAYKGTEASSVDARKVFPSGTSITKAMLENLVTVGDTEDKAANEADKPYGTPTIKIVSGLTETPGNATASGSYAVVLKAVDSQGKESDPLTVYVGVVSTDVKYQPKVGGEAKGQPKAITVPENKTRQGDVVNFTPEEITVDGKVYVPVSKDGHSVTLTDKPKTEDVEYVEKPASKEVSYQPKVGGEAKGQPKAITVPENKTRQGDVVNFTPEEITVDGKV